MFLKSALSPLTHWRSVKCTKRTTENLQEFKGLDSYLTWRSDSFPSQSSGSSGATLWIQYQHTEAAFWTCLPLSFLLQPPLTVPYVLLSHLSNESGTGFLTSCQIRQVWAQWPQSINVSVCRNSPESGFMLVLSCGLAWSMQGDRSAYFDTKPSSCEVSVFPVSMGSVLFLYALVYFFLHDLLVSAACRFRWIDLSWLFCSPFFLNIRHFLLHLYFLWTVSICAKYLHGNGPSPQCCCCCCCIWVPKCSLTAPSLRAARAEY